MGVVLCQARLITPELLVAAVKALASQAPAVKGGNAAEGLLPDVTAVRDISVVVAAAVIEKAVQDGLAQREVPHRGEALKKWIREQMWRAEYSPIVKAL